MNNETKVDFSEKDKNYVLFLGKLDVQTCAQKENIQTLKINLLALEKFF